MGISQNFDKNLKKSVKKQMPNLPANSKFIFQQLLKNSHQIEEDLEKKDMERHQSNKGHYCRCADGTLCHSTNASCYGQCCMGDVLAEYNVGNLRKVIRSLKETEDCRCPGNVLPGEYCDLNEICRAEAGGCFCREQDKVISNRDRRRELNELWKCLQNSDCSWGCCSSSGHCGGNKPCSGGDDGGGPSGESVSGYDTGIRRELEENITGCGKKEGKCCDGGDGRKCGAWTTMEDGDCKCSYGGPCCSGAQPSKVSRGDKDIEREMGEATSTASSGAYSTPRFWAKDKKNQRFAKQRWMPGAKYVKVKDKCKKFPYCNQGDINALEIWEKEIMRESAKNVSKKTGKSESEVREMIEKELAEIIRRSFYKSPVTDLVGGGKMNTPIGKIFSMGGNKPKYES